MVSAKSLPIQTFPFVCSLVFWRYEILFKAIIFQAPSPHRKRLKSLASSGSFDILSAGAHLVRRGRKWKKGTEIGGSLASYSLFRLFCLDSFDRFRKPGHIVKFYNGGAKLAGAMRFLKPFREFLRKPFKDNLRSDAND